MAPKYISANAMPGFSVCTDQECTAYDGLKHYHETPKPTDTEEAATFHTALSDAARAMCAGSNNNSCRCRDTASVGTCSDKFNAAAFGIATFLAHSDLRTDLAFATLASQISNRYLR